MDPASSPEIALGSWGRRQEEKCLGMLLPHRDLKVDFECIWHYSGGPKCRIKRVINYSPFPIAPTPAILPCEIPMSLQAKPFGCVCT